jgi:hypothetical protein
VITVPHVRRQTLHIALDIRLHLPIPQEGEAILVAVADVVVFVAGILDSLQEMNRLFPPLKLAGCQNGFDMRGGGDIQIRATSICDS